MVDSCPLARMSASPTAFRPATPKTSRYREEDAFGCGSNVEPEMYENFFRLSLERSRSESAFEDDEYTIRRRQYALRRGIANQEVLVLEANANSADSTKSRIIQPGGLRAGYLLI